MEDAKIVELYLQRDESAISSTAEAYGTRLRQISMNIVCDSRTAEECENDTYLQAFTNLNYSEAATYAYLIAIVVALMTLIYVRLMRRENDG